MLIGALKFLTAFRPLIKLDADREGPGNPTLAQHFPSPRQWTRLVLQEARNRHTRVVVMALSALWSAPVCTTRSELTASICRQSHTHHVRLAVIWKHLRAGDASTLAFR